jgi:hypothetical protein
MYCYTDTAASVQYTPPPTIQTVPMADAYSAVPTARQRTAYGQTINPSRGDYSFGTSIGNTVRTYVLPCHTVAFCSVSARYNRRSFFLYVQFLAPTCCVTGSTLNSKLLIQSQRDIHATSTPEQWTPTTGFLNVNKILGPFFFLLLSLIFLYLTIYLIQIYNIISCI